MPLRYGVRMVPDIRKSLAANAEQRVKLAAELAKVEQTERELVAAAWRAQVPPGEIAALARRSGARVRKLRPADVPPAKLGGNAKR